MAIALAVVMGLVLVGFIGLVLAGNVLKRLDDQRYAWIVVDTEGERIGTRQFDAVRPFRHGLAAARVGDAWGFVDETGTLVVPPTFSDLRDFDAPDRAAARDPATGKWGYVGRDGEWAIDPAFDEAWGFSEGVAVVRVQIGLRTSRISSAVPIFSAGLLRADGSWASEPRSDRDHPERWLRARDASEGRIAVDVQGKWGFVALDGTMVIAPQFDEVFDFVEGLAPVSHQGRWSFIDRAGATVVEGPYEDARPFHDDRAPVRDRGAWSFIDRGGVVRIGGPFEDARTFSEGYAAVRVDRAWGFVDRDGAWAVPPSFRSVEADVSEGFAVVTRQVATLEEGHVEMTSGATRWYTGATPFQGGVASARVDRR